MTMAQIIDHPTAQITFGQHTTTAVLDNGDHVIVDVDPGYLNAQAQANVEEVLTFINEDTTNIKHIVRPTVILRCCEDGLPVDGDLTPIATYPPGTTAQEALTRLEQE